MAEGVPILSFTLFLDIGFSVSFPFPFSILAEFEYGSLG